MLGPRIGSLEGDCKAGGGGRAWLLAVYFPSASGLCEQRPPSPPQFCPVAAAEPSLQYSRQVQTQFHGATILSVPSQALRHFTNPRGQVPAPRDPSSKVSDTSTR